MQTIPTCEDVPVILGPILLNDDGTVKEDRVLYEYRPKFLRDPQAVYDKLCEEIQFDRHTIVVYGKEFLEPRLGSFHAYVDEKTDDSTKTYMYSGAHRPTLPMTPTLDTLAKMLTTLLLEGTRKRFNGVLCNYYREGLDYIGWHSDSENGIDGRYIASISLGAERRFVLRYGESKKLCNEFTLASGSLFFMCNECQKILQHSLPKMLRVKEPRLNLTFRVLKGLE